MKETILLDDSGANTTSRTKVKAKSTSTRPRRNLQKASYAFDFAVKLKDQYEDYFKPNDQERETRLLGINEMVTFFLLWLWMRVSNVTLNAGQVRDTDSGRNTTDSWT